jgi:hypothetical protein
MSMDNRFDELSSIQSIQDLVQGWMYRDLSDWERLGTLFHPDGVIEITWFEGLFSDFIQGSMKMGASDLRTKHMIGTPLIEFSADRSKAIAETNAMVIVENIRLNLGATAHARLYDQIERRNGEWKIVKRCCIYDMASFTFPTAPVPVSIDSKYSEEFPREYAALAYLLGKSGFPVKRIFPTRGSQLEKNIKSQAHSWLTK